MERIPTLPSRVFNIQPTLSPGSNLAGLEDRSCLPLPVFVPGEPGQETTRHGYQGGLSMVTRHAAIRPAWRRGYVSDGRSSTGEGVS